MSKMMHRCRMESQSQNPTMNTIYLQDICAIVVVVCTTKKMTYCNVELNQTGQGEKLGCRIHISIVCRKRDRQCSGCAKASNEASPVVVEYRSKSRDRRPACSKSYSSGGSRHEGKRSHQEYRGSGSERYGDRPHQAGKGEVKLVGKKREQEQERRPTPCRFEIVE